MRDDLLRVAASVKGGHATAALVVGKLCSSRRQQNALAAAIKEYGALRRTVYAARYLADETYRRRIGRQLNKGENLHALKRSLAYAGAGALRRRHHEQQAEQMAATCRFEPSAGHRFVSAYPGGWDIAAFLTWAHLVVFTAA